MSQDGVTHQRVWPCVGGSLDGRRFVSDPVVRHVRALPGELYVRRTIRLEEMKAVMYVLSGLSVDKVDELLTKAAMAYQLDEMRRRLKITP